MLSMILASDGRAVSSDKNDDHEVLACVTRLRAINEGLDICWFVVKNGSVILASWSIDSRCTEDDVDH